MEKNAVFEVSVIPRSSKSMIIREGEDSFKVYLNSPPADGKANEELIRLFSKKLKIAKSRIIIIKGEKSRKKRILIESLNNQEIVKLLED